MSCWSQHKKHGSFSQQTQGMDHEKAAMLSTVDQLTLSDRGHSSNKDFYSPWHISTIVWSCQRMPERALALMELEMRLQRDCHIVASWLDRAFTVHCMCLCVHITLMVTAPALLTPSTESYANRCVIRNGITAPLGNWAVHLLQMCELRRLGLQGDGSWKGRLLPCFGLLVGQCQG